jgi:hypothetical protein
MRRIAFVLLLLAAVVGLHACAADAPTAPRPNPPGGGSTALQILLITNDANPPAGTCTLVQATVTVNGVNVPDGTGVSFSTDFGSFSQNGLPLVSVVTTNGQAVTALCGPGAGSANVRATATSAGQTGSARLTIIFQPSNNSLPFVSSCSPSFGAKEGGTVLTLNGGRFFGTPSTTRVQFVVNGVTKDGVVQSVSQNAIVVVTPGFPEFQAPQLLAEVRLSLGTNQAQPVVLSLPACFSYGTQDSGTPTIASLLPSSGTSQGGTRVTIVGSGFSVSSGVQVFFGTLEATVVSVSFTQIVVLTPLQVGDPTPVDVTVRNIGNGEVSNEVTYTYTETMLITGVENNIQPLGGPYSPVTIHGRGFQAPVAVSLAGVAAFVQSVSATELLVVPANPLNQGCGDRAGDIQITNLNTGSEVSGSSFTYFAVVPVITSVNPLQGEGGDQVTITGTNLPRTVADAEVKFGSQLAVVISASATQIVVEAPTSLLTPPVCIPPNDQGDPQTVQSVTVTVVDRSTACSANSAALFAMQLPCVVPPTPTVPGP